MLQCVAVWFARNRQSLIQPFCPHLFPSCWVLYPCTPIHVIDMCWIRVLIKGWGYDSNKPDTIACVYLSVWNFRACCRQQLCLHLERPLPPPLSPTQCAQRIKSPTIQRKQQTCSTRYNGHRMTIIRHTIHSVSADEPPPRATARDLTKTARAWACCTDGAMSAPAATLVGRTGAAFLVWRHSHHAHSISRVVCVDTFSTHTST